MSDVTYPIGLVPNGHCLWCGEITPPATGRRPRKWCSDKCGNRASEFRRTGKVPRNDIRPTSLECKNCGETFRIKKNGPVGEYCRPDCRRAHWYSENGNDPERRERDRARSLVQSKRKSAALLSENLLKYPDPRCNFCGGPSCRGRGGKPLKFCSKKCSSRADYERVLASGVLCSMDGCGRPVMARGVCGSHYSTEHRRKYPALAQANQHRRRARLLDAFVEDVDIRTVLERDGWMCGICGGRISGSAVWPDRGYRTLDHIVPLAKGGEHSYSNVQAAHFSCNSSKQDTYVEDYSILAQRG